MNKIIILCIFTLSLVASSCSHVEVKKTKLRFRTISSVSRSCINILHNLFDVDLKKIKSHTYHWQIKNIDEMSISSVFVRDAIYESRISETLGLQEYLKKELRFKLVGKVNILELYNKAILKKIEQINNINDFKNFLENLNQLDWPNNDILIFSNRSFLVQNGIVNDFGKEVFTKEIVESTILEGLEKYSKQLTSEKEFLSFFKMITDASFSATSIYKLLVDNNIYKNILLEHPQLDLSILNSFKENIRFESKDIFKQIRLTFESILQTKSKIDINDITSSYVFFMSLKKYKRSATKLSDSPYAIRMGITKDHITQIIKKKDSLEGNIKDVLPIYSKNKRSLSFDRYDGEIDINGVYDQCSWGSCWLQSNLKAAELKMFHAGEEVELSTDYGYLRFLDTFYKKHILEKQFQDSPFEYMFDEGATSAIYKHLIRRWGIVPSSVWKPKTRLHSESIQKFKSDVMSLMYQLKTELVEASTFFEIFSAKKKLKIQKNYLKKMDELLIDTFGEMPESFTYKGREFTPNSFMDEYLPEHSEDITYVKYEKLLGKEDPDIGIDFNEIIKDELKVANLTTKVEYKSSQDIDKIIIESIDNNRPVNIGVQWRSSDLFLDKNNKIIEYINNENGVIRAPELDNSFSTGGGHAVLIIGYELDINGNIKTLKILNSWGEHAGDRGIYHMDIEYFKNNLMHMDVNQRDGLGMYIIKPLDCDQPFLA